ncbi:universal stress protein [Shewanella sp. 10N.261.52.F9]|uniref:Universal stress protein A n=1 Tax=Shewanella sairae TaxID=190310 RepID=A0ABQ4PIQ0_9GAMM|nr:universal stress protein [Shewanella sairae]MCL1128899.1 universal stress protein [Shewanella sairae]GIU47479.1 universal stress protein A [Shewanella sairae]
MNNIVACIDGSKLTLATCEASAWAAQKIQQPLTLLHVLEKTTRPVVSELSGQIGLGSQEELLNELVELDELRSKVALKHGKQLLADAKELALVRGVDEVAQLQRHGNFIETLADFDADLSLLVMGKSGEEHSASSTIGSQLESVVRSIKSDIFVVSEYFNPPNAYMIAFDASDASELLIEKVIKSPLLASLECHLVMVSNHGDKSLAFEGAAERLKQAGLFITQSVLTGAVDEALLSYQQQQQLDMIVMGAYSHTRLRQYFVGSNTTQVLAKSIVPLLIMR